jgi:hypothetical protein
VPPHFQVLDLTFTMELRDHVHGSLLCHSGHQLRVVAEGLFSVVARERSDCNDIRC